MFTSVYKMKKVIKYIKKTKVVGLGNSVHMIFLLLLFFMYKAAGRISMIIV